MFGTVETLRDRYGFIRGDDGVSRFFLPSALSPLGVTFDGLTIGTRVKFVHIEHPRGPRAIEINIVAEGQSSSTRQRRYPKVDELGD